MIARAIGNGANTDIMKLIHNTTEERPKRTNLPVDSCGVCNTSAFILCYFLLASSLVRLVTDKKHVTTTLNSFVCTTLKSWSQTSYASWRNFSKLVY